MRSGLPALLILAALSQGALAQDQGNVKAGREKAQVCTPCHGLDGVSKMAEAPNLAGQNPMYLLGQLTAFKSGERQNPMMSIVAQGLSDEDIQNVVAYYAAIPVTVGPLPGD